MNLGILAHLCDSDRPGARRQDIGLFTTALVLSGDDGPGLVLRACGGYTRTEASDSYLPASPTLPSLM